MADWLSVLAGAAIGSVATIAWEGFLKPRIAGRSLAELLASDLSLQLQRVAAERSQLAPNRIPAPLPFPTAVYAAVIGRIGELPPAIVAETIALYGVLERLNQNAACATGYLEQLERADEGSGAADVAEHRLRGELAQWPLLLDNARVRIQALQPKLLRTARPRWSWRLRSALPIVALNEGEISRRVGELRSEVERRQRGDPA